MPLTEGISQKHTGTKILFSAMPSGVHCTYPEWQLLSSMSSAVPDSPATSCSSMGLDLNIKLVIICPEFCYEIWG